MRVTLLCYVFTFFTLGAFTQIDKPTNGVAESKPDIVGLHGITLIISSGEILENADIIIENGKISKTGQGLKFPAGAVVYEFNGEFVLPAFIELHASMGIKTPSTENKRNPYSPQLESEKQGPYYWNESIRSEIRGVELLDFNPKDESKLMGMGFGFVVPHLQDGVARGTAPVVALGELPQAEKILNQSIAAFFSLHKGSSKQTYPSSQMGAIALLKQAFIDAKWYATNANQLPENISLAELHKQMQAKSIFEAQDKLEVLRISKIIKEFNLKTAIICGGDEYQRIHEIKNAGSEFILPLKFPDAIEVSNPYVAKEIPLSQLKHWELAPANPYFFYRENITFALTAHGIEKEKDFWEAIHKTIRKGLPWQIALDGLTINAAKIIAMEKEMGTLESGKWASFNIYSANPFENKQAELLENWHLGQRKFVKKNPLNDIRGNYNIKLETKLYTLKVGGTPSKLTAKVYPSADYKAKDKDTNEIACTIQYNDRDIVLQFNLNDASYKGTVSLSGKVYPKMGAMEGSGILPNGNWINWTAIKHSPYKDDKKNGETAAKSDSIDVHKVWYPHIAFGRDTVPTHNTYLIRNATIWTGEEQGIIENGDVLLVNGKIKHVGRGTFNVPSGAKVIDAKGKIVTAGIIDEHSHIAISKGVNESGQSITAEVSIADVINPDDINIYRQLAGGVTCSQLLHGSANAIGGQSAFIKLKWGCGADELLLENPPKFIKFALGENVKQTNWGDFNTIRFPQTRMGVEQVYYDAFYRAKAYMDTPDKKRKDAANQRKRDLELEVLVEILKGERHITCHSYVQSEINMLMKVADSMGFKVNTFTHILEGYKLADKMREHGAGGSTFADWWAYKYEVIDAIPYNASILNEQRVVTAINSDDPEMGRRLNQEAAKSIKYGNMSPHDAWKMVTLNPAKLLHLDHRMGSLKAGKDADVVIWSDNPLSVNAKVEQTFIDGVLYYDIRNQEQENKRNDIERARLISLMQNATKSGEKTVAYKAKKQPHYHCDTEENENMNHVHE